MGKVTTTRIDDDVKQKLKMIALQEKVTLKDLIDKLGKNYIRKKCRNEN